MLQIGAKSPLTGAKRFKPVRNTTLPLRNDTQPLRNAPNRREMVCDDRLVPFRTGFILFAAVFRQITHVFMYLPQANLLSFNIYSKILRK
ncbi:hypothetical protein DMA11_20005 [Marinilabiliaceae bacterium JC017]|nr:hypothetical protein DMA11_20005 [Marinilabiliaceae bacterium JC017]